MTALKLATSTHPLRPRLALELGTRSAQALRPVPGQPGMLFFGGSRRSGTTWVAGMLNAHQRIECRNEGWIFNDLACSLPDWLNEWAIRAWAKSREAKGTWLKDQSVDEAILAMRRAMLQALYHQAIVREGWKSYEDLRWVGDKTTLHFCASADTIHAYFPDARFLHMLRDGRDVVVSDMFLLLRDSDFDGLSS
ncbi:MAG: sulfotransferase, partial [Phycisphaerales bacterium]|nr:sulfotransferase [Phycisphaerales bacterium]